ncbi:MAG: YkgJ family cysteine cluster protein [Desulfamplus sp.]
MDNLLQNYHLLLSKVDSWLKNLDSTLAPHMHCCPGCSECCKNFTVFPVEAYSMLKYIKDQKIDVSQIKKSCNWDCKDEKHQNENKENLCVPNESRDSFCIFLNDKGLCRIYPARPLICRTHGYPILVKSYPENRAGSTENKIDYCPKNFQDRILTQDYLKREHLIDVDHLNTLLFSINSLFIKQCRQLIVNKESNSLNLLHLFCNISDNVEKVEDAGRVGNGRLSFYDIISTSI